MRQRVTIFKHLDELDRNDFTPLVGAVDGDGNVTDPSFSTDPAHPRQWMKWIDNLGESELNPRDGTSRIGQATVDVVDPQDPAYVDDQSRRLFTALLADAVTRDTQLLDRRILFEQDDDDTGAWYTVLNGVIGKVQQVSDTTFRLPARDIRERERGRRVFTRATRTGVFPFVGPVDGWGEATLYTGLDPLGNQQGTGVFINFPNEGVAGVYRADFAANGIQYGRFAPDQTGALRGYVEAFRDIWEKFGEPAREEVAAGAPFPRLVFNKVIAEWQYEPAPGAHPDPNGWHVLPDIVIGSDQTYRVAQEDLNLFTFGIDPARKTDPTETLNEVTLSAENAADLPNHLSRIVLRMRSNLAPSDDVPLYARGTFGQLARELYDGVYSEPDDPPRVPYDVPAMEAFARNTPVIYLAITESVDNLFEWVAPNIYQASGYLPTLNAQGRLAPIRDELPDASVPLLVLDDANTVDAKWEHGADLMVNRVVVKYTREIVPGPFTYDRRPTMDEAEFPVETIRSSAIHGPKELVLEPETYRAIVPANYAFSPSTSISSESGARIGRARAHQLIDRLAEGAQAMTMTCLMSDPNVAAAREGDWCLVQLSWLPEYQTGRRSTNRLAQLVSVKRTGERTRTFRVIDAGPHAQPIAPPTVDNLRINADGTVTAAVSAIDEGAVELAIASVAPGQGVPPTNSGAWRTVARVSALGDVTIIDFAGGYTGYLRWRGVETGRRPSLWTVSGPLAIPFIPTMRDVRLSIDVGGAPRVDWVPTLGTGGVRISYSRHEAEDAPAIAPFQASIDVDATLGTVALPIVLHQLERVTVRVQAYPGFAGGAVTGALGAQSALLTDQRLDDVRLDAVVAETISRTTTAGTLGLTITDPSALITRIEFQSRLGNAGAWSAWVQDNALPYETSVTLVAGEASAIGYRVWGYDALGFETVLAQAVREFPVGAAGSVATGQMECRARIDASGSNATQVKVIVESVASDGTRGTVTLISLSGTSVLSGPSVGVATADPGTGVEWVLARPLGYNVGGGQWRALGTGFLSDDDGLLIPGQDVDTNDFPLNLRVRPHSQDADTVTVEVDVTDAPAAVSSCTIAFESEGVASVAYPGGAGTSGSYVQAVPGSALVTMTREVYRTGIGRVEFRALAGGRLPAVDKVDVPSKDAISSLQCRLEFVTQSSGLHENATYRFRVIDANPRASGNYAVYYSAVDEQLDSGSGGTIDGPAQGSSPGAPTSSFDTSTAYIDFILWRPSTGASRTRYTVTVKAPDGARVEASASITLSGFGI